MRIFFHGNLRQLSSFSIINRQMIGGLRRLGHHISVFPTDDPAAARPNPPPPDVYIFHGHPWEARSAPGRLNIFALNYEYLTPNRALRQLVARLNAAFDLVVVPSAFAKPVLAAAGLRLPLEVVPWGYDPVEFHPGVHPVALPTAKSFVFLYVGAVNERKGIDILLQAYLAEFSADDDVVLVIKESQRHPTWTRWLSDVQRRHLGDGGDHHAAGRRPEVVWLHEASRSVAAYFAAADVGVFPHRGEGFGLPILECIASGRRVIVTSGTGPAAFCSERNAWRIRASRICRRGHVAPEPEARHLRSLLRAAYARGKPTVRQRVGTARTVREWTWPRSVAALDAVIRRHLDRLDDRSISTQRRVSAVSARAPVLAYAFHSRGVTSWKKLCTEIDRSLATRYAGYRAFTSRDRFDLRAVDVVLGQSEHCLEVLLKARRLNPGAAIIVHQECTVLGDRVAIVNRERKRCGLAPIAIRPMDFWRNRLENALADRFLVASSVARAAS